MNEQSHMLWLAPERRSEPNAEAFAERLASECIWSRDMFGGHHPWTGPVPPPDKFEKAVDALNLYLLTGLQ